MMSKLMKGFLLFGVLISSILMSPVQAEGDPNAGVQIFKSNCAPCHGANMEGGIGPSLKDSSFVANSEEALLIQAVADGREDNGMPAFKDQLSEQEVQDVVALLKNPDVMAAQSTVVVNIQEPEVTTEDIFPGLKKSFLFIYVWTAIAIVALLAWIKHRS
ncbi:MAG: c-type cytochrome [Candidatus Hydrothermarchaeales archaeon]